MTKRLVAAAFAILTSMVISAAPVHADHNWQNYHWARTSNPFTLQLGDNMSDFWRPYIYSVSEDWSQSTVLNTVVTAGQTVPVKCEPSFGRVEICDEFYGKTGWLGIAHVWTEAMHITQGVVQMNDTYFTTDKYDHPAWKNLVLCQEVGHTLGLEHQDEDNTNVPLGTCMDYSLWPAKNQQPNWHDFQELELIYKHPDGANTFTSSSSTATQSKAPTWGKMVQKKGKTAVFEHDKGRGKKIFTFIVYAD